MTELNELEKRCLALCFAGFNSIEISLRLRVSHDIVKRFLEIAIKELPLRYNDKGMVVIG